MIDKRAKARIGQNQRRKIQNKGYSEAGASFYKKSLKGFNAISGSPQEDIDFNQRTLRNRARILYMSTPVATSAINTNRTNVVGVGLRLQPVVDRKFLGLSDEYADKLNETISREFEMWAKNKRVCDAMGMNDFYEIQQIALASSLLNGDVFGVIKFLENDTLVPYRTCIQLIESDRISTPTESYSLYGIITTGKTKEGNYIYDGVEVDKQGRVQAYYIRSNYPNEITDIETSWKRIEVYSKNTKTYNIVHATSLDRPEQYRGTSILAPVIESLLQLRRYTDAELQAAVIESFFTAFIKTEADPSEDPFHGINEEYDEHYEEDEYNLGPGEVNIMKPGESVEFADPKRPGNGFQSFVEAICTYIGAALDMPQEILLKKFSSNYSASRGALMEAWKSFKMRRTWFVNDFCNPIYEAFFSEAVALGRINAPGFFKDPAIREAYLKANWIGPTQGQLDPEKEVNAEIKKVEHGFTTREEATVNLNGGNWENNMNILKRENELMKDVQGGTSDEE